jgi:hypothetical protein
MLFFQMQKNEVQKKIEVHSVCPKVEKMISDYVYILIIAAAGN